MDSNGRPGLDHQPLLEAVLDEQSVRWGRGERPGAEEYFERFPALRDHPEAALDVIYQEFLLRRELGERPRPEEFIERFPFFSEPLIAQFATDEAMRSAEATTEVSAGTDPALHFDAAKVSTVAADAGLDDKRLFPSFPGYELIGVIGQGGMGVVYKARNTMLGRVVALKTITALEPAKPGQSGRFLDEARAAARLQHPNIITVHEIGEYQGRPYFVQEFVAGGDLKKRLADKPMAVGQAAELLEILARAVHAAHQAGVVHRDLKPSNILLTTEGVPKVADFGLAKLLGGDSGRTQSGQVVGTPSYMAPEQAEGRSRDVGPVADVYALGAILYEALTGRPPFLGESQLETLRLVTSTEVVSPHLLRPDVPRDLETICLKCLDKEPHKRYASADALAEDLRRFLEGRPITARPVGAAGKSWRWAKRNPWLAGLSAALVLTFVLGTPTLLVLWLQARSDRATARSEAAISKAVNEFLNKDLLAKASADNQSAPGSRPDPDIKLRDVLDLAAGTIGSRFAAQPLVEASIRRTIGETYEQLGLVQKALPHLERALELHRREQGPGHPDTLLAMAALGSLKLDDGKLDEAEALIVPAMDGLVRQNGPDDPDALAVRRGFANLHFLQGKLAEAEQLLTQVRGAYERTKGPHDPETLDVVNDLACVNNAQGNEAKGAGRHSEAQAKYVKAEQLLKVIVGELEQWRGLEHPATLVAKGNLADSYRWQGRLAKAIELREEVLAARRTVLGDQHPGTLYMMVSLAEADCELPNLKEAQSLLEEAVMGCRSALDRNHETVIAALAILANVYRMQGEIEKMGPVLIEAREITLNRWGPDHELTCGANEAVASHLLSVRKDPAKAEPYLRDSLKYLVTNRPEDARRFITESRLGYSLLRQKKYPEAKQLLLAGYSGMRAHEKNFPPRQDAYLANTVQWTAQLYHESAASRDDKDFGPIIRAEPAFKMTVLDLGFPADPFVPREPNWSAVDSSIIDLPLPANPFSP